MMGKLVSEITARLERAFPDADVTFVDASALGERRTVHLHVQGNTAPQIEAAALKEAREFFGPGPELHVEDGWRADRYYSADEDGNWYAPVNLAVHAHGPLAGPAEQQPEEAEAEREHWHPLLDKTHAHDHGDEPHDHQD